MNAEILCVGTELLLGDTVNTNAAYIAKELAGCGVNCYFQTVVGDNPQRLKDCLVLALERADMVITTGGLGPTYDDLTKETVAEYFGRSMELHQPTLERMEGFFQKINRPMTENNKKQAMMPTCAIIFENSRGTAPGLALEGDGKTVIMLPGPPSEMQAMFQSGVVPYLARQNDTTLVSHNIHFFGIGESALEEALHDQMLEHQNPTIAPYAKVGEVLLRVTASAPTTQEAEELTKPVVEKIRRQFQEYVYGVDVGSLQNALCMALREKGLTAATAESCTGGMVSQRITQIPGSSQVFLCGACTYSNKSKTLLAGVREETIGTHGAVSRECALEMARGIRQASGASIGISTTGIAGPDGGTKEKPVGLVYVAVSSDQLEEVLELHLSRGYSGERESIRYSAASHALSLALKAANAV